MLHYLKSALYLQQCCNKDTQKMHITRRNVIIRGGMTALSLALPIPITAHTTFHFMTNRTHFDTIIIGGSYAGLSAAMALGRALRNVLVIDSGLPCNRQTPHSHNFITQDGEKPDVIARKAKMQVQRYNTVQFLDDLAIDGKKTESGFTITTNQNGTFTAKKLIFATGVTDLMPDIPGFSECWGISVIHCPYCHGYEVKNEPTGIFANGDFALHYAQLIDNWTKDLTVFTNGKSTLTPEQAAKIARHNTPIVEKEIAALEHENGQIRHILFKDGSTTALKALYARPVITQHCTIPESLGCALTEHGLIAVDPFQKTSVEGVFACGDNTTMMRSVANAVANGNFAGAKVNNELIEEVY